MRGAGVWVSRILGGREDRRALSCYVGGLLWVACYNEE